VLAALWRLRGWLFYSEGSEPRRESSMKVHTHTYTAFSHRLLCPLLDHDIWFMAGALATCIHFQLNQLCFQACGQRSGWKWTAATLIRLLLLDKQAIFCATPIFVLFLTLVICSSLWKYLLFREHTSLCWHASSAGTVAPSCNMYIHVHTRCTSLGYSHVGYKRCMRNRHDTHDNANLVRSFECASARR